jgi:3-isopropylmalate/(R)-2-methylmalate dehydratase small subunit
MQKFTTLTGIAAYLPMINVDTDMIIPKQYLKTIKRTGLGRGLFAELRYDEKGVAHPDFVLHKPPYTQAQILITGENFGCGSSREHAPWALMDFGFRALIAPSYADIFFNNCFKNGLLPIVLDTKVVDQLFREVDATPGYRVTIDLEQQVVTTPGGLSHAFAIEPSRKHNLLHGLDEIGLTLAHADEIRAFEAKRKSEQPWLF